MQNTEATFTGFDRAAHLVGDRYVAVTPWHFQCKDCTRGFDFADDAEQHSEIYNHDVANSVEEDEDGDPDNCPDCGTLWTDHFDLEPDTDLDPDPELQEIMDAIEDDENRDWIEGVIAEEAKVPQTITIKLAPSLSSGVRLVTIGSVKHLHLNLADAALCCVNQFGQIG